MPSASCSTAWMLTQLAISLALVDIVHHFFIYQMLAVHALANACRLFGRVKLADILPPSKLIYISVKMLDAHLVVGSHVVPLQHRPERLNPVRMRHAVHEIP